MLGRVGSVCWMLLASGGAAEAGCRIALLLAMDVSHSVSARDHAIQRGGLIAALHDPEVMDLFLLPQDHVALAVVEWSGRNHQDVVVDWVLVAGEADLAAISALVAAHERSPAHRPTGIGQALEFGRQFMQHAPPCSDQVIDISGDGRSNDGMSPADAYAGADFGALVVNGLPIGSHEPGIVDYYREEVIRGPWAFVEVAATRADFPEAIRRKLLRELAVQMSSLAP